MQVYRNNLDCKFDEKKFGEIQGALNNAGASYLNIKMTDSAMYCFKTSLKFVEHNQNRFPSLKNFISASKGVIYQYIGNVYLDSGNNKQAEFYLKQSINFNSNNKLGTTNGQSAAIKLAQLYLELGRYEDYQFNYNLIKNSLDTIPDLPNEMKFIKLQIDYLNQTKQYAQAQLLYPKYLSLEGKTKESKQNINKIDIGTEFYNLQKDYELTLLKKENQLRATYLVISIAFTVLLFLLIHQLWFNWSKTKQNNEQLLLLNNQVIEHNLHLQETLMALEQSDQENNRIMKVIAHDLRSPIGAIVSLAGLMEDDDELAETGRHSISLIKASATNSVKFINELLNRNAGKKEIEKEVVELEALLK
ncbi:MAG: hypothetical protein EOO93_23070, partial [Pedobacter sp.]